MMVYDYDLIWEEIIETAGNSPDIALLWVSVRACVRVTHMCVQWVE